MRNSDFEVLSGAIGCAVGGVVAGLLGLCWIIRFLLLWFSALGGAGWAGWRPQATLSCLAPNQVAHHSALRQSTCNLSELG